MTSKPRILVARRVPQAVAERARREEVQGVFVVKGDKAVFQKVETGITGANDIEVTTGLDPGDQIVIGGYRAAFLRGAALADALAAIPPGWTDGTPVPLLVTR